jgi:MFS transporter, putative metabolite:H+ symporter
LHEDINESPQYDGKKTTPGCNHDGCDNKGGQDMEALRDEALDLSPAQSGERRRFSSFTKRDTDIATIVALAAWTVAVFDYGLLGTLLPVMQQTFGWTPTLSYAINTWISVGSAFIAFGLGPIIDRLGRRSGMMLTVGGTAIVSALTAMVPVGFAAVSAGLIVIIRSFGGLGFSEQAVNATYINEVYQVTEDERKRRRPGYYYAWIQGGWPLGFMLASALSLVLLNAVGWRGLYLVATLPAAVLVWVIFRTIKETPQFRLHQKLNQLERSGRQEEAHALAAAYNIEHSPTAPLKRIWGKALRGTTFAFSLAWIFNFFGIMSFSILGSSVLKNAKGVHLSDAFWMLIIINLVAYFGYVFHGWLGDKIGRKATIIIGWIISSVFFTVMLSPMVTNSALIVGTYAGGLFFLVGPYAAIQYFMAECYPVSCRATGVTFIGAMSQPGIIIGGALFTVVSGALGTNAAAVWVGAVGIFLSALIMILTKQPHQIEGFAKQPHEIEGKAANV